MLNDKKTAFSTVAASNSEDGSGAIQCRKCSSVLAVAAARPPPAVIEAIVAAHECPAEKPIDADAFELEVDRLLAGKPGGAA